MNSNNAKQSAVDFAERVRVNQRRLRSNLKSRYDFIVCGSGSSGSVVARRPCIARRRGLADRTQVRDITCVACCSRLNISPVGFPSESGRIPQDFAQS